MTTESTMGKANPLKSILLTLLWKKKRALMQKAKVGQGKTMMDMVKRRELPCVRRSRLLYKWWNVRGAVILSKEEKKKKVIKKQRRSKEMDWRGKGFFCRQERGLKSGVLQNGTHSIPVGPAPQIGDPARPLIVSNFLSLVKGGSILSYKVCMRFLFWRQ
jgi:hypothetical protein